MRESIFQSEWMKSWRHHYPFSHYCKIPDMPRSAEARFIPLKPYDCFALYCGAYYAMELKIMTKVQAFPFNKVTEWQVHNLREVEKNGGNAFIVINYRSRQISEQARKRFDLGKTINTVFVIPIAVFDDLDNKIDSKSMAYGDISGNSVFQLFKRDSFWEIPIMIGD